VQGKERVEMNHFSILIAEMKKSHQHNFHNKLIYFSLLLWPILSFTASYFSFKPFDLSSTSPLSRFIDVDQILLFLLTGYLGFLFFWSLVQSAWQMSYERQSGTLEVIFLSPVSRISLMYARAAGSLIESVWLFTAFTLMVFVFTGHSATIQWVNTPIALFLLSIAATVWGGFLNTIFLFSRDAGILYSIFQEPMEFFAGVKIPLPAFPMWGKMIGLIFPLTYVLDISRKLVLSGYSVFDLGSELALLSIVLFLFFGLSVLLVRKAEKHAKETGSFVLF
jgi:ABC-2 type transport system permease protein